jgi:hypothetical protein
MSDNKELIPVYNGWSRNIIALSPIWAPSALCLWHHFRGISPFAFNANTGNALIGSGIATVIPLLFTRYLSNSSCSSYIGIDPTISLFYASGIFISCISSLVFLPVASYHTTSFLVSKLPVILRLYK